MIKDDEDKVRCPNCGRIYRGIYTDGYLWYHDCPGCGYDDFVLTNHVVDCPED